MNIYIIITEELESYRTTKLTNNDLAAADDGILSIFDVGSEEPTEYIDGEWVNLEQYPTF